MAKNPLPPDTRAMRREIAVALIGFLAGSLMTFAALARLLWRFVVPEALWWDILNSTINIILISIVGGLAIATGALWFIQRLHYRQGVYRCPYCDRPFKGLKSLCDCPEARALPRPVRSSNAS